MELECRTKIIDVEYVKCIPKIPCISLCTCWTNRQNKTHIIVYTHSIPILIHRPFSTALTWSQCEDSITLHALPTTHCTNIIETTAGGIYHTDLIGGYDYHGGSVGGGASSGVGIGIEDVAGDDFDYAMDCGDFIF